MKMTGVKTYDSSTHYGLAMSAEQLAQKPTTKDAARER